MVVVQTKYHAIKLDAINGSGTGFNTQSLTFIFIR